MARRQLILAAAGCLEQVAYEQACQLPGQLGGAACRHAAAHHLPCPPSYCAAVWLSSPCLAACTPAVTCLGALAVPSSLAQPWQPDQSRSPRAWVQHGRKQASSKPSASRTAATRRRLPPLPPPSSRHSHAGLLGRPPGVHRAAGTAGAHLPAHARQAYVSAGAALCLGLCRRLLGDACCVLRCSARPASINSVCASPPSSHPAPCSQAAPLRTSKAWAAVGTRCCPLDVAVGLAEGACTDCPHSAAPCPAQPAGGSGLAGAAASPGCFAAPAAGP